MIRALLAATAPLLVSASLAAAGGLAPPIIVPGAAVTGPVVIEGGAAASPVIVEDGDVVAVAPSADCANLDAALRQLEGQGWGGFTTTPRGVDVLIAANRGTETGQFVVACEPGSELLSDDDDAGEGASGADDS